MNLRLAPTLVLAETALELERLALDAGRGTVGTIGEIEVDPGLINAIASRVRFSLDIRGPKDEAYRGVARDIATYAARLADARGMHAEFTERQTLAATPMDERIVGALEQAVSETGEPYRRMHSGAAHDTMCVADGFRPLQGRDQPPPGRGRGPRGRGARRRDHAGGDRSARVGRDEVGRARRPLRCARGRLLRRARGDGADRAAKRRRAGDRRRRRLGRGVRNLRRARARNLVG